jgi:glycosyltransferase 2 family protein
MKRLVHALLLLAVAAILWLMFRNTDWREVFAAIQHVRKDWLLLSMAIVVLSFFTRVQRWTYIVRTAKPVSFRHMFSATQIGFLANFTLPARIGEVIRAVVLAKLAHMPFSKCFAMVALDRVTDLVGLLGVILATILAFKPQDMIIPKATLGFEYHFSARQVEMGELFSLLFFLASVIFLVSLYVKQALVLRLSDKYVGAVSQKLAARAHDFLKNFSDALHIFRSASDMAKCVSFSLLTWGVCVFVFVTLMNAFEIHYPWYTPLVMEMLLAVAISVPGPPGFIGQFQVPIIVTLVMLVPGIEDSKAKAMAIVAHVANLIPVTVIGVFCLVREQFGFVELTRESRTEAAQQK